MNLSFIPFNKRMRRLMNSCIAVIPFPLDNTSQILLNIDEHYTYRIYRTHVFAFSCKVKVPVIASLIKHVWDTEHAIFIKNVN